MKYLISGDFCRYQTLMVPHMTGVLVVKMERKPE